MNHTKMANKKAPKIVPLGLAIAMKTITQNNVMNQLMKTEPTPQTNKTSQNYQTKTTDERTQHGGQFLFQYSPFTQFLFRRLLLRQIGLWVSNSKCQPVAESEALG